MGHCQIEEGYENPVFSRTLPRSSGCSNRMAPPRSAWAFKACSQNSTSTLDSSTVLLAAALSQGRPRGYRRDLKGRGPAPSEHLALENVVQGGEATTALKSPSAMPFKILSLVDLSRKL